VFRCDCWAPPTSLFLLNREMRQDALQVFYGQNRFVVTPTGGFTWTGLDNPPTRLPISVFLSSVVPQDALHYLRLLEMIFPPFGVDEPSMYCSAQRSQWQGWADTLEKVQEHLDLQKLTIRAYFAQYIANSLALNILHIKLVWMTNKEIQSWRCTGTSFRH
jgi:hypothetical protein